jgi:lysyl-tRNA synthetase class II
MKPPVKNIEDLMEMWSVDCQLDETEPGRELLKIPSLHAKYLRILSHHNLLLKQTLTSYNKLKKMKWEYYSGDLNNPEDLEKYNLEPWVKKTLRQDIPMYLDADQELNNLLLKKLFHQEIVDFCTGALKELHSRTFQLKSFIEWERFTSGG